MGRGFKLAELFVSYIFLSYYKTRGGTRGFGLQTEWYNLVYKLRKCKLINELTNYLCIATLRSCVKKVSALKTRCKIIRFNLN